ncbi:MAG: hypothetical protein WDK96_00785 [Candidatus Paceibacterota bacterium]|jgi:ribulose-phosphate 3-epimerase
MQVIPAIIPKNFNEIKEKVSRVVSFVPYVQLDLMNGNLCDNVTWPFQEKDETSLNSILNEKDGMPYWEDISYEFHLMIKDAIKDLEFFLKLGASRIIFHITKDDDFEEFNELVKNIDIYVRESVEIGISINLDVQIESIKKIIPNVDFVQCMAIEEVGFQGKSFDNKVLEKISDLRKEYPELTISVDGGVNLENAEDLKNAGADRLVVGSAIFKSLDIEETIEELKNM